MTFASPAFLWALTAVALPVIIHLFNFQRYKKVYFSNVKFLKEIQMESKSRSRLRELLVLACRCLAIAALVLAFSQPVITDDAAGQRGPVNTVALYIDNSFSMDNVGTNGPLLQNAVAQARDLVRSMGNGVKFYLLTNDFEGRHQRFCQQEDMLHLLDDIRSSATPRRISEVIRRQKEFLLSAPAGNKRSFIFSDLQKSTFDLAQIKTDTSILYTIVPQLAAHVNNLCVDTCWFETPLQQKGLIQKLHAVLWNHGNQAVEAGSARLLLNGQQAAISSFSLGADQRTEILFTFTNKQEAFSYASIKIDDYPVHFDDELFFAFNSQRSIAVTVVNGKQQQDRNAITSLFRNDSLFKLEVYPEASIDYASFKTADVILLNEPSSISSGLNAELQNFAGKGGVVVLVPSSGPDLDTYNTWLAGVGLPLLGAADTVRLKTDRVEYAATFFEGVFEKRDDRMNLPSVRLHYPVRVTGNTDFEPLMNLQNGDVFVGRSKKQKLTAYLFTAPLDPSAGNFARHALFVPAMYKICFSSLNAGPLFYTAGTQVNIPLGNLQVESEVPPHISGKNLEADIIPELRSGSAGKSIQTRGMVERPGYYALVSGKQELMPLAFNYSRVESDLSSFSAEDVQKICADKNLTNVKVLQAAGSGLGKQVAEEAQGKKLWKLFLILTLLFIATEAVILRILK